eukprot:907025-Pleurochrysis_carterae.AAC.1
MVCASQKVTELVRIEVRARGRARERDLGVVQNIAVVCEQCLAKVERRKLLHTTQCEECVDVVVGGFRRECLAFGSAVVKLVVVDAHRFTPRLQVANRGIGPQVDKWNESFSV